MALEPGTKLGPYEILAPIAAGAGEVYKAAGTQQDRSVAQLGSALGAGSASVSPDPGRPYICVALNWALSLKR